MQRGPRSCTRLLSLAVSLAVSLVSGVSGRGHLLLGCFSASRSSPVVSCTQRSARALVALTSHPTRAQVQWTGGRRTVPSEFSCLPPHTHTASVRLVFRAHSTHPPRRSHYARTPRGRLVPASRFGDTLHATSHVHRKSTCPYRIQHARVRPRTHYSFEPAHAARDTTRRACLSPRSRPLPSPRLLVRATTCPPSRVFPSARLASTYYPSCTDTVTRHHRACPPSRVLPVLSPISSPSPPPPLSSALPSLQRTLQL